MSRKNGLGTLYFGKYNSYFIKARQVNSVGDVSSLTFSKLQAAVKAWPITSYYRNIENYIGVFKDKGVTYILTEAHLTFKTLKELIVERKLNSYQKTQVLRNLFKVMKHCADMGQPMYHGHLHPGNILVFIFNTRFLRKIIES